MLGRSKPALKRLGALFASGRAGKTYWAVVVGRVAGDAGVIDAPLDRRSADRRSWWMKVDPAGDPSLTRWRVLGRADGLAWLELSPETGRTHQLRVHCAHAGWPIAGDHIYGGDLARSAARHMHLHARRILLPLDPARPIDVSAEPPSICMSCFRPAAGPEDPIPPDPREDFRRLLQRRHAHMNYGSGAAMRAVPPESTT